MVSLMTLAGCGDDDETGGGIANEIGLSGSAEQSVIEGDGTTTVSVSYSFAAVTRNAGSVTINAIADNLTYGVNYTTDPAESSGAISITFPVGAASVSFDITVIDDDLNLPDGSVTFTLAAIDGEDADISATAASFTLNIQDNEGESITPVSEEVVELGDVVPGTSSEPAEVTFTTLNIVSDMTATASTGFEVSDAVDGTYAATTTLSPTATSAFVRASPEAGSANGELTGTVVFSVADVSVEVNVRAVIASAVGQLFWVENFDYPTDATYPAYMDTYPVMGDQTNWGIVPVSAKFRATAPYNGTDGTSSGTGLERTGVFDTWYTANRLTGIAMGDGPLSLTGYPGSGMGRTVRLALDYANQRTRPSTAASNPCASEGEFSAKNSVLVRRFVDNGEEITSGNVYFSAMIKVNELFDEATPTLKNAVMMLTGDAAFVNNNAMKVNVQKAGAGFNFGVSKSSDDGPVQYGSTEYTIGETYAIVFKVEIKEDLAGDPPNDIVSLYVFKEGDAIPSFEDGAVTPEAQVDETNQDAVDAHDVVDGLETFYCREVADVNGAGGPANIAVHDVEFSGVRVGTSWSALFLNDGDALYDSNSGDDLQAQNYGWPNCTLGGPEKIGNTDK